MNRLSELLRRLRMLFAGSRFDRDLDEEMRLHRELRERELLDSGEARDAAEAHYAAQRRLGNSLRLREESRDAWGWRRLEHLLQDARYGLRSLRKNPGFAATAVVTLALGIGACTAIFSVVNAALLRPLSYRDPSNLVWADEFMPHLNDWAVPNPEFTNWSTHNQTFEAMAAYDGGNESNLAGAGEPEHIETVAVTANFFAVLGIQPALGRSFVQDEDRPAGPPAVLLTDSLWRRKFSADPGIVGESVDLDGRAYTVIGILPASFRFPDKRETPQCLRALQLPSKVDWSARRLSITRVIGRLAPGVSLSQARADLATLAAQSNSAMPVPFARMRDGLQVQVIPLHQKIVGDVRLALLLLFIGVLFVLLIACANVASLQLVRTAGRHKELAVRAAIGASRARVVQLLIAEGASLAAMGGAAGLLIAAFGVRLLRISLPETISQIGVISIDRSVLLFTLTITCLTVILFGLAPALRASGSDVNEAIKKGGSRPTSLRVHRGYRGALVLVEFALAFLLLIGSGLLIRSFIHLSNVAPGFDPANMLAVSTELPDSKYSTGQQRQAFFSQVLERIRQLAGVHSVGLTTQLPFGGALNSSSILIEGQPEPPRGTAPTVSNNEVSPDYFQTMHIPLLAGRSFSLSDLAPDSHVIVVSAAFAQRFLPAGSPLSKRVRLGGPDSEWSTVVGVVGDVRYAGLDHAPEPLIYLPFSGEWAGSASVVIRSDYDPRSLVAAVRAQFASVDPSQPVFDVNTMQQRLDDSIDSPRFNMALLTIFASLALVLAAVGLHGVISYLVSQRTHEIGLRMALGARPVQLLRLVVGEALSLALVGVVIGVAGALAVTRFIRAFLFEVSATDPLTFVGVAVLLLFVAFLAGYVPARRAMRVDPMVALRYE